MRGRFNNWLAILLMPETEKLVTLRRHLEMLIRDQRHYSSVIPPDGRYQPKALFYLHIHVRGRKIYCIYTWVAISVPKSSRTEMLLPLSSPDTTLTA